jgi:hypothetical protein
LGETRWSAGWSDKAWGKDEAASGANQLLEWWCAGKERSFCWSDKVAGNAEKLQIVDRKLCRPAKNGKSIKQMSNKNNSLTKIKSQHK